MTESRAMLTFQLKFCFVVEARKNNFECLSAYLSDFLFSPFLVFLASRPLLSSLFSHFASSSLLINSPATEMIQSQDWCSKN